ncbi:sarcosine oxidase subunit gamma [Cohaesibacter sp. ES.047]|uniref:sarcosine oxidase subunit gamma n=1 Tax=Cohaesibacter sp. ES.047 TaxID=1798205 RepID=UPI000BC00555|nr:sarcosine oxidase subunit gamma family protein [Cohaesibacter sp. ES.047]SNY93539.1 sarcosine oxidase subunit gamma [Cohaesibacter sp. ES.047]
MAEQEQTRLTARSPLGAFPGFIQPERFTDVALEEVPHLTQISIRGNPSNRSFTSGIKQGLDVALPIKAGNVNEKGGNAALWLGPDEWLIVTPDDDPAARVGALEAAVGEATCSIVDVSDNRTTLKLSGPNSWTVLNKVSSLDFHPSHWKRGTCAGSLCGHAQAFFWQRSAEPEFYILVRNSFARYTAALLLDAMQEFRIRDE